MSAPAKEPDADDVFGQSNFKINPRQTWKKIRKI